jgi:hypothetical protein
MQRAICYPSGISALHSFTEAYDTARCQRNMQKG